MLKLNITSSLRCSGRPSVNSVWRACPVFQNVRWRFFVVNDTFNQCITKPSIFALLKLSALDFASAVPYKKNKIKTKIQTTFDKKENPLRKSKPFAPRNLPFKTEESKRRKVESNISDTAPLRSERQCD
jgi:hypothetical protein